MACYWSEFIVSGSSPFFWLIEAGVWWFIHWYLDDMRLGYTRTLCRCSWCVCGALSARLRLGWMRGLAGGSEAWRR
jgi:hypothetical protein